MNYRIRIIKSRVERENKQAAFFSSVQSIEVTNVAHDTHEDNTQVELHTQFIYMTTSFY